MSRPALLLALLSACGAVSELPDTTAPLSPPVASAGADLVVRVGESVTFDASASQHAAEARWTFGDGDVRDRSAELTATHTFDHAGHFVATVEVFGADGRPATDSAQVTVTWPTLDEAPRTSSTVTGARGLVFVAMPDFDTVAVVEEATGAVVDHLTGCAHPRRVATADRPNGSLLAVSCEEVEPAISLYDVSTAGRVTPRARLDLAPFGWSPFGVVVTATGDVLFTARERVSSVGILGHMTADGALIETLRFGSDLRGLAIHGDDVWVSQHRSPDDGGRMWHLNLEDGEREELVVPIAPGPDSDTNSRGVPSYLSALVLRPDGRTGVIGGLKANIERGLVRDGLPLTDETTVRADLRQFAVTTLEGPIGEQLGSARLDNRDLISAAAWLPRGDWLYLAVRGVGAVDVFDSYSFERANTLQAVGDAPDGLWVNPAGASLYVDATLSRELVVYDLTTPSAPALVRRVDLRPDGAEVLPADVLTGKQIFSRSSDPRMTLDGYVSCASCHLDGEEDGRTWDFTQRGEGLRNTISLRGFRDHAEGPIHWSGNFDEIQDFEGDIRNGQGGRGFLSDDLWASAAGQSLGASKAGLSPELDALAAYVESIGPIELPALPVDPYGLTVFRTAGCDECHPSGGTDSSWTSPGTPLLHDLRTLGPLSGQRLGGPLTGIDSPDLRGVWATGPWLHDGSAPTLESVLTDHNIANLHGDFGGLPNQPIPALVDYLRTL